MRGWGIIRADGEGHCLGKNAPAYKLALAGSMGA